MQNAGEGQLRCDRLDRPELGSGDFMTSLDGPSLRTGLLSMTDHFYQVGSIYFSKFEGFKSQVNPVKYMNYWS